MNCKTKLLQAQAQSGTPLCVGLDTDAERIPSVVRRAAGSPLQAVADFTLAVIEATSDVCCAYKVNVAFYEQHGAEGWSVLDRVLRAIPEKCVTIADAKRGDIGNTSAAYAKTFFERFSFDAVTVSPYMGRDSVEPFLRYADKMTFVLALTSNPGSADFQRLDTGGKPLYRRVVETALGWASKETVGFVVGATHPAELAELRSLAPENVFLIPGVGAQGASASETMRANGAAPAIINVSRGILYASEGGDFAEKARLSAIEFNSQCGDVWSRNPIEK